MKNKKDWAGISHSVIGLALVLMVALYWNVIPVIVSIVLTISGAYLIHREVFMLGNKVVWTTQPKNQLDENNIEIREVPTTEE